MKTINTTNAPAAIGPYSQAQVTGNLVITSGQLGVDPSTGEMPAALEAQCELAFRNVKAVLEAAGSSISKTVKTTVFITDMKNFGVVNGIYSKYFSEPFPARSCIEVSALPKGGLVECEVIAEL